MLCLHTRSTSPSLSSISSVFNALLIGCPLTKDSRPPAWHQLAISTALEGNRLVAGTSAVPECAHCLRRLVLEAGQHLVQLKGSEGEHEPFAVGYISGARDEHEGIRALYM